MRYLKILLILLLIVPVTMTAQIKRRPTKTLIGKVKQVGMDKLYVKPGEFKIDFENKIYDEGMYKRNNKFFVIVRDKDDNVKYIKMNNHEINLSKTEYPVEILRAGLTIPDLVYIDKRNSVAADDAKHKYYLHVSGKVYGPYEGFTDIFPTGYVCKTKDVFTFRNYDGDVEDILPKNKAKELYDNNNEQPLFGELTFEVPVECDYDKDYVECDMNGKLLRFKMKNGVVYQKTHNGHYFLLYNDSLMDNTLMVVDGKGYELDGAVNDVVFKFSQNGSHWMSFCPHNLMVDGETVCRNAADIKFIAIKNDGEFAYVVEGEGLGDKFYLGDEIFADGINVLWLSVDDQERFNYICRSRRGYFYGIDRIVIERNEQMKRFYYPTLFDNDQVFTVTSSDGRHTFVYSYDRQYILIDGKRMDCTSVPHYAAWDDVDECFKWNTVENLELYLYSFKVR